jgi:hypothetical protein
MSTWTTRLQVSARKCIAVELFQYSILAQRFPEFFGMSALV